MIERPIMRRNTIQFVGVKKERSKKENCNRVYIIMQRNLAWKYFSSIIKIRIRIHHWRMVIIIQWFKMATIDKIWSFEVKSGIVNLLFMTCIVKKKWKGVIWIALATSHQNLEIEVEIVIVNDTLVNFQLQGYIWKILINKN